MPKSMRASWGILGVATDSGPPRRRRGAAKIPPRGDGYRSSKKLHLKASWGVLGAATDSEPPRRRRGAAKIPPGVVPGTPPKSDLKKIALGRPGASKTLPRWVPSWTPKSSILKAQVGLHLEGVLEPKGAAEQFFWRPKLPPTGNPSPKQKMAAR